MIRGNNRAFTLIELLVVISIIALLASVVIASLNSARDKGRLGGAKYFASQVDHIGGDQAVGLWDFDECSTAVASDRSGFGNNGSFTGLPSTPSDTPNGTGCSVLLNGSSQRVGTTNSASLNNLSAKTISLWIKLNAYVGSDPLGSHFVNKADAWFLASDPSNNRYIFGQNFSSGNARWSIPLSAIPLNRWSNIVVAYDNSSTSNVPAWYVDGMAQNVTQYSAGSGTASDDSSGAFNIGSSIPSGRWTSAYVDGVHLFSKVLSASDVSKLFAEGKMNLTAYHEN